MKKFANYSLFYFFQIGYFCFPIIFLPLYCKYLGYDPRAIAFFSTAGTLSSILGPIIVTQLAHSYLSPKKIALFAWFIGLLAYFLMFFFQEVFTFSFLFGIYFFCFIGVWVLIEAYLVKEENNGGVPFEKVRLYGSVGFIVVSQLIALFVDIYGKQLILVLGMLINILIVFFGLKIRPSLLDRPEKLKEKNESIGRNKISLFQKDYILVVLLTLLIWASHGVFYVYLSIYLRALEFSAAEISFCWNLGVVSEIILFMNFSKLEKKFSIVSILRFSCLITILRWLLLSFCKIKYLIIISNLLHAFTFATFYLGTRKFVVKVLPAKLSSKGQGILSGIGSGCGSFLGRLLCLYTVADIPADTELNKLFIDSTYIAILALMVSYLVQNKKSYFNKLQQDPRASTEIHFPT